MGLISEMQHCYKRYTSGETEIFKHRDVSSLEKGELVIILGASGAKIFQCLIS